MERNIRTAPALENAGRSAVAWIAGHQLIAYFAFTFAISWAITLTVRAWLNPLYAVAPFIVSVAIMALILPTKSPRTRTVRLTVFVALTVALYALLLLVTRFFVRQALGPETLVGGLVVAAVPSWLLTSVFSPRQSVRDFVAPLFAWRVSWRWYAFAVLFWPAAFFVGMGVDHAFGGKAPAYPYGPPSISTTLLLIGFVLIWGGGLEEVGWRGFALPRFQMRFSPLVASLIVGFFWALWHVPEYFTGQYTASSGTGPAMLMGIASRFLLITPPLTILFTWIYNRTGGNLLLPLLAHASFDVGTAVFAISTPAYLYTFLIMWIVAIVVVVQTRMWRRVLPGQPGAPVTRSINRLQPPAPTAVAPA